MSTEPKFVIGDFVRFDGKLFCVGRVGSCDTAHWYYFVKAISWDHSKGNINVTSGDESYSESKLTLANTKPLNERQQHVLLIGLIGRGMSSFKTVKTFMNEGGGTRGIASSCNAIFRKGVPEISSLIMDTNVKQYWEKK